MKFSKNSNCPCGSHKKYKDCCQVSHKGSSPKTPLALMKSRYCAYVLCDADYLIKTTHENNAQFESDFRKWKADILQYCKSCNFEKLNVLNSSEDGDYGFVEFEAIFIQDGQRFILKEKSKFEKVQNRWFYLSGDFEFSQVVLDS